MTLNRIIKNSLALCLDIEKLPASRQQTRVSVKACQLRVDILDLLKSTQAKTKSNK